MASYCFRPHQAWTQLVAGKPCSPELGAETVRLKEGVSLEVRLTRALRQELRPRHGSERDSLREITGSCKKHQTGAYGFLLFLTEMWIKEGRPAEIRISSGHLPSFLSKIATGTNNLANK